MKILIWGTGTGSEHITKYLECYTNLVEILAYVDNKVSMHGEFFERKEVISPEMLKDYEYDYIVIASVKYDIIKEQCIRELKIVEEKILSKSEMQRKVFALAQYEARYSHTEVVKKRNVEKIVVYTANLGDYDNLMDPLYIDERIRYVCFTDNREFQSSVWEVRYVNEKQEMPLPLAVRYYKFFPHKIFPEYDISVWVDSKFLIVGNLIQYIEKYQKKHSMLCFPHFERDCIYKEAVACISFKKGDPIMLGGQMYAYYQEGYPMCSGLYEGGCLVRWHQDDKLQSLMQAWWAEINRFSWRDQVSLPYVAWKQGFGIDISDLDISSNMYLKVHEHK